MQNTAQTSRAARYIGASISGLLVFRQFYDHYTYGEATFWWGILWLVVTISIIQVDRIKPLIKSMLPSEKSMSKIGTFFLRAIIFSIIGVVGYLLIRNLLGDIISTPLASLTISGILRFAAGLWLGFIWIKLLIHSFTGFK